MMRILLLLIIGFHLSSLSPIGGISECRISTQCESHLVCQNDGQCGDPCSTGVMCGDNSECRVVNHNTGCSCPPGYYGDPFTSCSQRTKQSPVPQRACGTNGKLVSPLIAGGGPAQPDDWPWMAALVEKGGRGSSNLFCGGSLISETHVLTAAHCFDRRNHTDIQVKLGELDFDQNGETEDQTFDIKWVKTHENYINVHNGNDIGIIKIDRAATLSRSVWTLCLPSPRETFTKRSAFFAIGWGSMYVSGQSPSSTLQMVPLKLWMHDECKENYATRNINVLDTMMCAGESGRNPCGGDSGGPLNYLNPKTNRWELAGIVSYGPTLCTLKDHPAVYTRVTEYLDWIETNKRGPNKRECRRNSDCPSYKACFNQKCRDACYEPEPKVCGQGATCKASYHQAVCYCSRGFEGDPFVSCHPNEKKDLCSPNPCGLGANCRSGTSRPVCSCPVGFVGDPNVACSRDNFSKKTETLKGKVVKFGDLVKKHGNFSFKWNQPRGEATG